MQPTILPAMCFVHYWAKLSFSLSLVKENTPQHSQQVLLLKPMILPNWSICPFWKSYKNDRIKINRLRKFLNILNIQPNVSKILNGDTPMPPFCFNIAIEHENTVNYSDLQLSQLSLELRLKLESWLLLVWVMWV